MDSFFSGNSYETPDRVRRYPLDILAFGSRWGFYLGFFAEVIRARRAALDGVYDDARWARSSFEVFNLIERCGGRFSIEGFDILRTLDSPVVFVANHMSTLETQVLPSLIAPFMRVTFVVKESLVQGDMFGPIMRSRDPVSVTRKHPGKDLMRVLEGGEERLRNGVSLVVFPQSTRTVEFIPEKFNSLGVKVARRAGVSVVPVALKTDFWENGALLRGYGPLRRDRTIHFAFGEPISSGGSTKEVHRRTVDFIERRLESWK